MIVKEVTVKLARKEGRPNYGSDERAITLTAVLEEGDRHADAVLRLRGEARRALADLWDDGEPALAAAAPVVARTPEAPPVAANPSRSPAAPTSPPPQDQPVALKAGLHTPAGMRRCSDATHGAKDRGLLTTQEWDFSIRRYGRPLCRAHQLHAQPR